jgi:hypothetical protein
VHIAALAPACPITDPSIAPYNRHRDRCSSPPAGRPSDGRSPAIAATSTLVASSTRRGSTAVARTSNCTVSFVRSDRASSACASANCPRSRSDNNVQFGGVTCTIHTSAPSNVTTKPLSYTSETATRFPARLAGSPSRRRPSISDTLSRSATIAYTSLAETVDPLTLAEFALEPLRPLP